MKFCFKCGIEKPLSEFYKHSKMADGHLGKCKDCTKNDARALRNENIERIREYDRARAKLGHRINKAAQITARRRAENPEMYSAHVLVNNAVRDGRIKKHVFCQTCGKQSSLHGHHDDYTRPLDVVWLCAACHAQRHLQMKETDKNQASKQPIW